MATQNDNKIKTLLQSIEAKKVAMGAKPRAVWRTNGLIEGRNINTLTTIEACVDLTSAIVLKREMYQKACDFLGLAHQVAGDELEDALVDLKLRVQILQWDAEKKKLAALENQLKDLRSEDLKTEDALAAITKDLG